MHKFLLLTSQLEVNGSLPPETHSTVVYVEDRDKFLTFVRAQNLQVQVFDRGKDTPAPQGGSQGEYIVIIPAGMQLNGDAAIKDVLDAAEMEEIDRHKCKAVKIG